MRKDLEDIKVMLVPEVKPTKEEVKAIEQGRKDHARGDYVEWKEYAKRKGKRFVS